MTAIEATTPATSIDLPAEWMTARDLAIALAENGFEDASLRPIERRDVCPCCDGRGVTWHGWGRGDACAFTASEWAELDTDDQDGYMSGRYDGQCPECHGANVVVTIELHSSADVIAEIEEMLTAEAQCRAAEAQERAYGC